MTHYLRSRSLQEENGPEVSRVPVINYPHYVLSLKEGSAGISSAAKSWCFSAAGVAAGQLGPSASMCGPAGPCPTPPITRTTAQGTALFG